MNKTFTLMLVLLAPLILYGSPTSAASSAKVTARVVDENGVPVKGADVMVGFTVGKKGDIGLDDTKNTGKSDKDGLFTATGDTILPQVTIRAQDEGYYRSGKWAKFTSKSLLNRWQPWNPTVEVVLKKKRNPVGMVARDTGDFKVPVFNMPVGFDLEKGDWVAPYGSGMTSDFIIEFHSDVRAFSDYACEMRVSFSNEKDGIQVYEFDKEESSYYKWPFEAPIEGYLNHITKKRSMNSQGNFNTNFDEKINYIFRVRTKLDKDGNIVSANYGKILRDFEIGPEGHVLFYYYFNPDGTTNLEFDPLRNLAEWKNRQDKQSHAVNEP